MSSLIQDEILLRPFEPEDAERFARAARESSESTRPWLPWCTPDYSEKDALAWFEDCAAGRAAGTSDEMGIFARDGGAFLGGAGLNSINKIHRFCTLGYWVAASARRRGVALRAVRAMVPHAFKVHALQRVEIVVAVGNSASEAVARKFGAHLEGIARNRLYLNEKPVAAKMFAMVTKGDD